MLIVCMYGCVSDRMGPRLCTRLLRMGIFGRWRSSWTIPRTRRPSSRYGQPTAGTTYDLTYHIFLYTHIRTYIIIPAVWQYLAEEMPSLLLTPIHTSTYVVFYTHVHAYSVCMYVCMYLCTYYVYTVCICYDIGVVSV
jgi:hypothetical protein